MRGAGSSKELMSTDHARFATMNVLQRIKSLPIMRLLGSADHRQHLASATYYALRTSIVVRVMFP